MVSIWFDDNQNIVCPLAVLEKLPKIKNLADGQSSIRLCGRSPKLFREIVDFLSYSNNDIPITEALITELDFYGYEVVSPILTTKTLSEAIELLCSYQVDFPKGRILHSWIMSDYDLHIDIPQIAIEVDGVITKADHRWDITLTPGKYLPRHIYSILSRMITDNVDCSYHTIKTLGFVAEIPERKSGDYIERTELKRITDDFAAQFGKKIVSIIIEDKALILRLMKASFYIIDDPTMRQYFLLRLMEK